MGQLPIINLDDTMPNSAMGATFLFAICFLGAMPPL